MSIKRKLTLTIMGISLAAIALTVAAITTYLIYDMRKEKVSELAVTAGLTGDRNSAGLVFLDNAKVQENLEIFRLNPSILTACIYDAQGMLFASYKQTGCPATDIQVNRTLPNMITAFEPIKKSDEKIGSVFLVSDTSSIDAYVRKILQISATAALCVMCVTLLLTFYFQRTISGPILHLAAKVESITRSKHYEMEAGGNYTGETGILARAFNEMVEEVQKRDRELKDANESLELKVTVRTRQLEESTRKAQAANEAKTEFLRNMSHEFRTPLHAITSFTSYGVKEYETAERSELKKYFEILGRASDRLIRLVNEVLDLAKLEKDETAVSVQPVNLYDLSNRAIELVEPLARDKGLTLTVESSATLIPVSCDLDKMVQVITNLLGNAVKFTPAGKSIILRYDVATNHDDRHVKLSVIDQGIGIPEEETEVIFESFRQSTRTNTGAGGTGLGLAISRGIINAHGGKIWAENNASGEGACVSIILPLLSTQEEKILKHQTEVRYENAA